MIRLRDYQQKGIDLIRDRIRAGDKKIILWSMTGAGKGLIMSELNRLNVLNGRSVLNVMRRKTLIHQTADNFKKYHNLESSVIMASDPRFNPDKKIQVGSIDTLQRRYKNGKINFLKNFNTVLIDEMHDTTSQGYRDFLDWLDPFNNTIFIGLTATPFKVGNKFHDWWNSCVKPIEAHQLRDQGYLVPDKIYAPKKIDLSKLKKVAGDFHQGELFDEVSKLSVIGDVVDSYKKYGKDKPAILFAVNIAHSKMMVAAFNKAGIPARHCDQENNKFDRDKAISDLKNGIIKVLCNVNIFSTGVDAPFVEVGSLARPTMSEVLDLQQRGRFLRPYKICICGAEYGGEASCFKCGSSQTRYVKTHAIILDHANNTDRHGLTYSVRQAALTKKEYNKTLSAANQLSLKQCPKCFLYLKINAPACECGHSFEKKERSINEEGGDLHLLDDNFYRQKMQQKVQLRYAYHTKQMRYKRSNANYAYIKLFDEFGIEVFKFIKYPKPLERQLRAKQLLETKNLVFT